MKTVVFVENKSERSKAEDARPIMGNNYLVVADGLGSGIKHTNALEGINNLDAFFYRAFKGILEYEEHNKARVRKSFVDLEFHSERYSSAYFASGVTALTIFDIFENGKSKDLVSFLETPPYESKEELTAKVKSFEKYFGKEVKINLNQFKENLALEDERPQMIADRNHFLPTTIVGCAFDEKTDHVDTLLFWAGDSRAYILDDQGLAPVTNDDQEHSGGNLTNFIQILRPFHINCEYRRFKKPVILMAMSDGVFDKKVYGRAETSENCLIPMEFEKEILNLFIESSGMENLKENAEKFYAENMIGDDSATLAVATFGFNNYFEIQELCRKRLEYLNEIMTILSDGFDWDAYDKGKKKIEADFIKVREDNEPRLKEAVKNYLRKIVFTTLSNESNYESYFIDTEEIIDTQKQVNRELRLKMNICEKEISELQNDLYGVLEKKWLFFRTLFTKKPLPKKCLVINQNKRYQNAQVRKDSALKDHNDTVQEKEKTLKLTLSTLEDQLELIRQLEISKDDYVLFQECRKEISDIFDYIEASIKGKESNIRNINRQEEIIDRISSRVWKQEENKFTQVKELKAGNYESLAKYHDHENVSAAIKIVEDISHAWRELEELENSLKNYKDLMVDKLYEKHFEELIRRELEAENPNTGIAIPGNLKQVYRDCKKRLSDYEQANKEKCKAYEKFKDSYCRYYNGDLNVQKE